MPFHVFLLYGLLISNVVLRLFTNKLGILPKAFNVADVFFTAALCLSALRHPAQHNWHRAVRFGGKLVCFNLVLVLGALLNLEFFHAPAAASQWIMWNEPLVLFWAVSRLPFTEHEIETFRRWLIRLLILEFAFAAFQVPLYIITGETEQIIGTFYGNAEQYQGFIMLAVFYLLAREKLEPDRRRKLWTMVALILVLIVLIDNKASWLGVMVSILCVVYLQQRGGFARLLRPRYLVPIVALFGAAAFVAVLSSSSLGKLSGLGEAWRTGNVRNLGKIKAFDDIFHAFGSYWQMVLVGSGPGNFYSRSGTQFYVLGYNLAHSDVKVIRSFSGRTSNSMGGVINQTTKPPFYEKYYLDREIFQIGSGQVDSPFASYAALLGETGVVGTLLYLSIYWKLLRRLKDAIHRCLIWKPSFYPFAIATFAFFVYIMTDSVYNSWLETGRMTTIAWAMAALTLKMAPLGEAEIAAPQRESGSPDPTPRAVFS